MSRLRAVAPWELGLLAVALAWAFAPIALVAPEALREGHRLTGADGPLAGDQLQYLAWVRDAAGHLLAGNLFDLPPGARVFLHPMYTLSGLATAAGASIPFAYWLWKPVAVLALAGGAALWARRLLAEGEGARAAGACLALFSFSPLSAALLWAGTGSAGDRAEAAATAGETFLAGALWGYAQTAIAVGLMPVTILAVERALRPDRSPWRPLVAAAAAGLVVSWLHPWQGVALIVILAGAAAWPGQALRRRALTALPAAGILLPLGYYAALARFDPAWELASRQNEVGVPPAWAVALALGGLGAPALLGLRAPGPALPERALLLWIFAGLASLLVLPPFPSHALAGLSLPLAVLAVRGALRVGLGRTLAVGAVALATLPGVAYVVRELLDVRSSPAQQLYLLADEARALDHVKRRSPAGGVLAPLPLATAVPSQTGRAVWMGHPSWTPDFAARARAAADLFAARLSARQARALVRASGARVLISDCRARPRASPDLAGLPVRTWRFGCATVYEVIP